MVSGRVALAETKRAYAAWPASFPGSHGKSDSGTDSLRGLCSAGKNLFAEVQGDSTTDQVALFGPISPSLIASR